jgi:uncharacterized protein (TIGR03086 family)
MTTNEAPSMEDRGKFYARALDATRVFIAGIKPDQLEAPTPCAEWNVKQLMQHVISGTIFIEDMFDGKTVDEVGDKYSGDLVGSDPSGAYNSAADAAKKAIDKPGAMEQTCHLRRGDMTGAAYVTSMFTDVLVHAWDVAKATGQDTKLDPELIAASYAIMLPRQDSLPVEAFGTDQEITDSADLQTKLLGLLGRSVDWAP